MLSREQCKNIELWFKENGIPKDQWEYLIQTLNSHQLTLEDGDTVERLLSRYDEIKKLTEKLQREIDLLSDQSLKELDVLLEDNLLREQIRLKKNDPVNRLTPRHLGGIDISLYLSSLLLTCMNIPKVKKKVKNQKVYETLSWFCYSLEDQYHFGINQTKVILFIKAVMETDETPVDEDAIKQQLYRLSRRHNWDHSKRTF